MRKAWWLRLFVLLVTGMALTGCPESCDPPPDPTAEPSVTSVSVTPSTASIAVGETVQLAAVVVGEGDFSREVSWSSDDDGIVTVDADGLVTGAAPGVVAVTATSVFDPGFTGGADITVGAFGEVAGVVILTPDVLLVELGEAFALEAVAYDSAGGVVTDAVIDWSSSDPSIVSVDSAGVVTAEEVVGSVTISATWQDSTDSIYVLVALLTPDTVRIARADVISVGSENDTAVLARNPTTDTLGVGDVFTSGEVLGRITAVEVRDDEVSVDFEHVDSLDEAFSLFYLHVLSDPVDIEGSLSPEGMSITTSIVGVRRTSFLQPRLSCDESEWDSGVDWDLIEGKYEFELNVRTEFEHGLDRVGWGLSYTGSRALLKGGPRWNIETPGIQVEAAVQGALDCFASAGAFKIPMLGIPGIITIDGVVEPRLGFKAVLDASGEMRVTGPALKDGHVTFTLGFEHDPDDGLEWIFDADASLGDFEPLGDLSVGAETSLEAGPYLSISGGVGIVLFASRYLSAEIHFAEPRLYLTLDGGLETPILRTQSGYKGLGWALQYGVKADLKIELAGGATAVLDFFDIPTSYGRRGMDIWGPVVWAESPTPTVEAEVSRASAQALRTPSPAAARSSAPPPAIIFTSEVPEQYEGDQVEFWGFADGATTCSRLTQAVVDGQGVAIATWQPGSNDVGEYAVRAHLHSGVLGRIGLPYPSSATANVAVGLPPIAVDDELSFYGALVTPFGAAVVEIDVLANDVDPAGGLLRIVGVTQPALGRGTVTHSDELVSYQVGHGDDYQASFEYTIENEVGGRDSATVRVYVGSLRADAPTSDWLPDLSDVTIQGKINELGDAVATSCDVYEHCRASLRRAEGSFVDLGTLGGAYSAAMGLNDAGLVVGWSHNSSRDRRPFVWDTVGGMRDLEAEPQWGDEGVAMAVNAHGVVVGAVRKELFLSLGEGSVVALSAFSPGEVPLLGEAVVWRGGVAIDLHAALESKLGLVGEYGRSIATGVTDGDPMPVVVGTFYPAWPRGEEPVAFAWSDVNGNGRAEVGEIVLLPSLGGGVSRVTDVNERGLVVGVSETSAGVGRPVLWDLVGGVRELAQLPGRVAVPRGINVHGQVVGDQTLLDGSRVPLYWAGNAMAKADDVQGLPSGWVLESLHDINDRGDMVGVARTSDDRLRAILIGVVDPGGGLAYTR